MPHSDEIAARYGLTIDLGTLAALAQDGRVQRPDIEVLEAVALILRVRVDDLLDVRAMEPAAAVSVVSDDVLLGVWLVLVLMGALRPSAVW